MHSMTINLKELEIEIESLSGKKSLSMIYYNSNSKSLPLTQLYICSYHIY